LRQQHPNLYHLRIKSWVTGGDHGQDQSDNQEDGGKKKPAARKAAAAGDNAARLRAALLHLIATQGWRDLSLAAIAEEAELDMASAHDIYPTKGALLLAWHGKPTMTSCVR